MGNKSSIIRKKQPKQDDGMEEFTIDTMADRAMRQLKDKDPELVPYFNAINSVIHSPDDFYIPCHATKLDDCLYLGSIEDAKNVDLLKQNNITYIINTVDDDAKSDTKSDDTSHSEDTKSENPMYDDSFKYMGFSSEDAMEYPIMDHFEDTHAFIEKARENNAKCLIHCMRGVNRSGALATAHIMVKNKIGPITATQIVYKKRGMLLTNPSFVSDLLRYARDNQYLDLDKNHVLLNKTDNELKKNET